VRYDRGLVPVDAALVDRLAAHRTVGVVPRSELEWVAARSTLRELKPGEVLTPVSGDGVAAMYVVLSGRMTITVNRGTGPRKVMEWIGGDLTGFLPYSRIKTPPGDVVVDEPTTVVGLPREHIEALKRECPELTAVCVHVMLDRARAFTSSDLLDEKMVSLGRLAAGLAHELNNPASAVARNAASLGAALTDLDRATRLFCALGLPDAACREVDTVRAAAAAAPAADLTPIERADRQDGIADWLDGHGAPAVEPDRLVDAGWTLDHLQRLSDVVNTRQLGVTLDYVASAEAARRLSTDIERAASRIHDLVSAVKRFTHMDQAMVGTPTALGPGLSDTLTMLEAKARHKDADLRLHVEPDLPLVEAIGGELNQVWTNLIDNALDAIPRGGRVVISAGRQGDKVVVRVSDNGPGIPPEIRARIFDPFFTTKDVGKGSGLGLDITRRLVLRHRGTIELRTDEAGTVFEVALPVAQQAAEPASEGQRASRANGAGTPGPRE
jgi:signal transduction histidine kinase